MKTRPLTRKLLNYFRTHFSIAGFPSGPPARCANGHYVNQVGPDGIEVNRQWYDWQTAEDELVVEEADRGR